MKIKNLLTKFITIFSVAIFTFTLSACSLTSKPKPGAEVIKKFQEVSKNIKTIDAAMVMNVKGNDDTEKISVNLTMGIQQDVNDPKNIKLAMDLDGNGSFESEGKTSKGDLGLGFKMIKDDLYFNLKKINIDYPEFNTYKSLLTSYINKWQHIPSDIIPQSIKDIQKQSEDSIKKQQEVYAVLAKITLFDVIKEYGVESLDGQKVYHYGVKINKNGAKQYFQEVAKIMDITITETEITDILKALDYVDKMELWIGYKDYFLYKALVSADIKDATTGVDTSISATFNAKSYNKKLNLGAPADYTEFNPLALMMGVGMMGTTADTSMTDLSDITTEDTSSSNSSTSSQ